ncbi:hypothetical protein IWZ03DRAFT_10133 [Phyllosticta citriasiana]|uniref:Transmembrane protein n=1 Tax=Phyllosticta citriasiana TaxID=595635 RepID=A0ABR1KY15_9PEZI
MTGPGPNTTASRSLQRLVAVRFEHLFACASCASTVVLFLLPSLFFVFPFSSRQSLLFSLPSFPFSLLSLFSFFLVSPFRQPVMSVIERTLHSPFTSSPARSSGGCITL